MISTERLAIDGGRQVRTERLPLHRPYFDYREARAAVDAIGSTHVAGDGPRGRELERVLRESLGVRGVLAMSSCSAALEISLEILALEPGDEVILPSFTFVSTANAVIKAGGRPVFADIDPITMCLDPVDVAKRVTPRTRALLPVHYAGMACDMPALEALAASHRLVIVEDAAHAVNASAHGRALGAWGAVGSISFHETKDVVCGEGGALIVRDDEALLRASEILREKGTDRTAFLRGERDKYTWVAVGSSAVLSEILAAVAVEQLAKLPEITRRKTAYAERLLAALAPYRGLVELPTVPDGCRPNWHLFAIRIDPAQRDWVIKALAAEGVGAAFHYIPLHSAPYARKNDLGTSALPVTDRVAASLVRLPISAAFTDADCDDVARACAKVFERMAASVTV